MTDGNTRWDYTVYLSRRFQQPGTIELMPDITQLWETVYADGDTDLDKIKALGEEGWELAFALPIIMPVGCGATRTEQILFIFKRLKK